MSTDETSLTPIWDELLATMTATQVRALRDAVRGELREALRIDTREVAGRLRSLLGQERPVDSPGEGLETREGVDGVDEDLVGVDGPVVSGLDVGEELAGDGEVFGEVGGEADELEHDSPSVGPGAGTPGGDPTVGAAGDVSDGVDDSAVGHVTEDGEEPG